MRARDKKSKALDGAEDHADYAGAISREDSVASLTSSGSHEDEEPAERLWSDGLVLLLHVVLPIAITGAIVGRKAIFSRLWTHVDKSFLSVFCPSFSKREKLKKWMNEYLPNVDGGLAAMWKDGSLMCTLINSVVPGACPNPHRHWRKPPVHGQALAYKYLGVTPVFSELDFQSLKPEEKLLVDYVCALQAAVERMTPDSGATFSTRYVARGMGLVTGEQHRKTVIYVYPNFEGQTLDDLLVNIRGPFNTYGSATLKAAAFSEDKVGKAPHKRQSFLKSLSADFSNLLKPKERGPACDIEIKTEFERDRAKLVFVPNNSGVYEVCLTTNGEHIAGSPFNLSVEKNRSGITENLHDEEAKVKPDSRSIRKKVSNTVIYYEKLKQTTNAPEVDQSSRGVEVVCEEKCQISLPVEVKAVSQPSTKHEEDFGSKTESKTAPSEEMVPEEEEYAGPILETLEELNNLLENSEKNAQKECEVKTSRNLSNYGLNIIDTMRNIPQLKKASVQEILIEMNTRDQTRSKEDVVTQKEVKMSTLSNVIPLKNNHQMVSLEDSGTYENDDLDPDSLTSSLELQGSSEEIYSGASGTGSDLIENENEVNNNDIMVKSNEDICYLILNQDMKVRPKWVYSKDFISCKDERSKDDLSRSDSNLQLTHVSALSEDNVQEAHEYKTALSSRMFPEHPQEAPRSYSHENLLESDVDGSDFKRDFLRRKAFWTNLSMSTMSLADSQGHKSCGKLDVVDGRPSVPRLPAVRSLVRCESARSLELRSRSLDYVRQRRRAEGPAGRCGSADDLNFPSVRDRREMYLSGARRPAPRSQDRQELYAVKGEKYPWCIHEKIKSFEAGSTSVPQEKLQTLPENITVKTKIREGFSKARRYFKHLETGSDGKRRHSVDGDEFVGLDATTQTKPRPKPAHGNTVTGCRTLDPSVGEGNELEALFNERRKKKQMRVPVAELFK